jgi:hypothetical protein
MLALMLVVLVVMSSGVQVFGTTGVHVETFSYSHSANPGAEVDEGEESATEAPPSGIDPDAVAAAFNDWMINHNNRYGSYTLGVNGCTTLTAWFVGEYTTVPYKHGNGAWVARNLNIGTTWWLSMKAPAIYSVAPYSRAFGALGKVYGHTGVVLDTWIEEEIVGLIIVYHYWAKILYADAESAQKYSLVDREYTGGAGLTFVNMGSYLK